MVRILTSLEYLEMGYKMDFVGLLNHLTLAFPISKSSEAKMIIKVGCYDRTTLKNNVKNKRSLSKRSNIQIYSRTYTHGFDIMFIHFL